MISAQMQHKLHLSIKSKVKPTPSKTPHMLLLHNAGVGLMESGKIPFKYQPRSDSLV